MLSFKEYFLLEGTSSNRVLYHFTDLDALVSIVKQDRLLLTMATGANNSKRQGDRLFYLSTSRIPTGEYGYNKMYKKGDHIKVMIVLDASKLAENHKIIPYNYWGATLNKDENEDRVLSHKESIPAFKYIKEIRILLPKDIQKYFESDDTGKIRSIINSGHNNVQIYDNYEYFTAGVVNKAITGRFRSNRSYNTDFIDKVEFLKNPRNEYPYTYKSEWGGFLTDLHNIKKSNDKFLRGKLQELANLVRREKVSSIEELINKTIDRVNGIK